MNYLTDAETERLAKLTEEIGESNQIIGKILLHGYESHHPDDPVKNNCMSLHMELGDILAAINLMVEKGDLDEDILMYYAKQKSQKITKYMKHQD